MSQTFPPPPSRPISDSEARLWSTLLHLGGILFYFLPALIGYLALKDRSAYARSQAAAALNFQLTVLIGYLIGAFTTWLVVGFLVLAVVSVANLVLCIVAAVAANAGQPFRYPMSIRFVAE